MRAETALKTFYINKGRIIIYRLFDVASEIDLSALEKLDREGAKRLKFSKYPYMKALEFANPPISFELASFNKVLFNQSIKASVVARAYDFGVLSVAFDMPVPPGTSFSELEEVTKELDIDKSIESQAREYIKALMDSLGKAVISPEIKEDFIEDYMIIYVEELMDGVKAPEFLRSYDPTRLLLYESGELSRFTRKETLRHGFSYYPDDFIIVNIDNAFIIEPTGSLDLPDILEFANAQYVELRYYDHVIDKELKSIYAELSGRRVSFFSLRRYERLLRKITRTISDITEVTEKVNNSLKVTEDIYYAKIYRAFMALLRSRDWETGTREKLEIVMNAYKMLHDDISAKREYAVELGIFILIIIEMVMIVVGSRFP